MHASGIFAHAFLCLTVGVMSCHNDSAVPQRPTTVTTQESRTITVEGTVVCLPHRSGTPGTFECVYGLRESADRHYGLRNLKPDAVAVDERIRVTGRFTPGPMDPYDVVGTIDVTSLSRVGGGS